MAHLPREVLAKNFGVAEDAFEESPPARANVHFPD